MLDANVSSMTYSRLKQIMEGDAVAIRGVATLQPVGGAGDKVFPPSHSIDDMKPKPGAKYAFEDRRIHGSDVRCVLLDSVQSQANRMEEALQELWEHKRLTLPVITTDFNPEAPDVGVVSSLTAPHRIADALLRDSMIDGTFFRLSDLGKSFTDANFRNAGPLFKVCPTALVFGLWDSTGPKGGLGAKFARALVSEIVGVGAAPGVKTSSRIDPTGIITKAAEILVAAKLNEGWTHDPALAKQDDNGKPERLKTGRVSEVNHSNVPPTIDDVAGGTTFEHAQQTVVLSLATFRRLRFGGGDVEARTTLAALGLLAVLAAESRGHDLRSRCFLVPEPGRALSLEIVHRDGSTTPFTLDSSGAVALYEAAVEALPTHLRFECARGEPIARLKPSEKLLHLVRKSRELAATGAGIEE